MTIALYGGSFDPIHIGHLITAQNVIENYDVEKVIFIPSHVTPLKNRKLEASDEDRLKMTYISTKNNNKFIVSDYEIMKKELLELKEKYNDKLPKTMEELLILPGVGRKTANVILGDLWNIRQGIVVDTHVKRLSNLIGFVESDNPEIIERELMKFVPKKYWFEYSHYLILHGRDKCVARRPKCLECEINKYCKHGQKLVNKDKDL